MRAFLSILIAATLNGQMLQMGETSEGFQLLFNGRDLDQWDGDPAVWKVDRSRIAGSTEGGESVLVLKDGPLRDFELRYDVRVLSGRAALRFRASAAAAADDQRGFRAGEWNEYSIYCKGSTVRVRLNGAVVVERSDSAPIDGVIALELPPGKAARVEFRNLRIKKFD